MLHSSDYDWLELRHQWKPAFIGSIRSVACLCTMLPFVEVCCRKSTHWSFFVLLCCRAFGVLAIDDGKKLLPSALHNIIVLNWFFFLFFLFLQDCENLLKRFLVLNPTKRSRLEVGIFTVLVSISCSRCSLQYQWCVAEVSLTFTAEGQLFSPGRHYFWTETFM